MWAVLCLGRAYSSMPWAGPTGTACLASSSRIGGEMKAIDDDGEGWWRHATTTEREQEGRGTEEEDEGHAMTRMGGQGDHQRGRSMVEAVAGDGEDAVISGSVTFGR